MSRGDGNEAEGSSWVPLFGSAGAEDCATGAMFAGRVGGGSTDGASEGGGRGGEAACTAGVLPVTRELEEGAVGPREDAT